MTKLTLIIVVVSYLLGSIPFGYLLVRIFRGQDVRQTGSGNIGATNVARTGSKGLAIATLLLDALKGYVAVAFAFWLAGSHRFTAGDVPASLYDSSAQMIDSRTIFLLAALAAFCAILGHMFPVWLRFKGGKGVATAAGAFVALAPKCLLLSLLAVCHRLRAHALCFAGQHCGGRVVSLVGLVAQSRRAQHRSYSAGDHGFFRADHCATQRQHPAPAGGHRKPFSLKETCL